LIKILIVDDHDLVRFFLRKSLSEIADFIIAGEANDGEEALKFVASNIIDIVLMDIKMEGVGGLEATRRLVKSHPNIKIIVLSAYKTEPYPYHLIQAGAKGYLTKDCHINELIDAIRKVHEGQSYVKSKIAEQLVLKIINPKSASSIFSSLSQREMEVVLMLINAQTIREISQKFHISPKTVSTYRYRLFQKLKIKNNVDLIRLAIEHGILDNPNDFTTS
jgi:two-component system, NarL family, invasion response regulator UvrY